MTHKVVSNAPIEIRGEGDSVYVGDYPGGDYAEVESDGTVKFNGAATVWDDLRVSGLGMKVNASAPDFATILAAGTLMAYVFDGSATLEQCYFMCQLPHSYKEGTDIYAHVHWMPTTADAGTVVWQLEYTWVNIDAAAPAALTIEIADDAAGTAWTHQMASFAAIDGSPVAGDKTISSMFIGRLFRDPDHADDDYEHDAVLLEFDIHFEMDTVGSRQESIK